MHRLILFMLLTAAAWAQSQADLAILISASEFFAGRSLSGADRQLIAEEARADLARDPAGYARNLAELRQLGASLSSQQDPMRMVEVRQAALAEFYKAAQAGPVSPSTRLVVQRAQPLAFDPRTGTLLLADDLDSSLSYLDFLRRCQGGAPLSGPERARLKQQLTQGFATLPDATKAFLITGRVTWAVLSHNLARLNAAQQAQLQQQLAGQTGQMGVDNYEVLSRMSRATHLTTMNILENMGGSGDYWSVEDRPGW